MFFFLFLPHVSLVQAQESTQVIIAPDFQNHIQLRMGYSTATSNGQPTICLEGNIWRRLSLESCGTGFGFIHRESGTDFVHFRSKWSVFQTTTTPSSQLYGQLGAGFAEIQLGEDELGFQFTGTGLGVETAGPELSASLQWIWQLAAETEMILDTNIGAAFFTHGPSLIVPQSQWFPFWELSIGLGW